MDFIKVLEEIKKFSNGDLDIAEMEDSTIFVSKNFIQLLHIAGNELDKKEIFDELFLASIRHLKVMCTKGSSFQNLIINTNGMLQTLQNVVSGKHSNVSEELVLRGFQLLANLCVKNEWCQEKIWRSMSADVLAKFESDKAALVNVGAMIVYNILLSKVSQIDLKLITRISLRHFRTFLRNVATPLPDFVHILTDFVICKSDDVIEIYSELQSDDQKTFLYYVHDYVDDESNEIINRNLLTHLTKEFKAKSDCILKTVTTYVDSIDPDIVVILLDIISSATAQEKYLQVLKDDRSLFLNLGCLLQALHKIGKTSDTIFSPIQSLDAMAPTSNVSGDFEKEISFAFKTKLVKSLANLSHRNKKNQELAREMEIMLSIFECTTADARNPLIKEWSILAIRNLCEDNLENQAMVKKLTKVGDASNPLLKELGLEAGMLRIGK